MRRPEKTAPPLRPDSARMDGTGRWREENCIHFPRPTAKAKVSDQCTTIAAATPEEQPILPPSRRWVARRIGKRRGFHQFVDPPPSGQKPKPRTWVNPSPLPHSVMVVHSSACMCVHTHARVRKRRSFGGGYFGSKKGVLLPPTHFF